MKSRIWCAILVDRAVCASTVHNTLPFQACLVFDLIVFFVSNETLLCITRFWLFRDGSGFSISFVCRYVQLPYIIMNYTHCYASKGEYSI